MKVKKEIWVEICDFCEEKKTYVCSICGKDICGKHSLTVTMDWQKSTPGQGITLYYGTNVARNVCPDHLGLELTQRYEATLNDS